MQFKAVVFDLDGTLLNTVEDIAFAMNSVLARNNLPTHRVDDYRFFVGSGLTNLVYQTLPKEYRAPQYIEQYLLDVREEYSKCLDDNTKPYSGIYELFDALTIKNIPLAILSNKPHQFMHETIKTHFSKWSFKIVFGARDGVPTKPDPQSAIEISEIMNISPEQIVYVGDADVDMITATRAGMYPVGVSWGFRPVSELLENGAKKIINHPSELVELFV